MFTEDKILNDVYYNWVKFIIDHRNYFLIWVSDDKVHFMTKNDELIFFEKLSNAKKYAEKMGLKIPEDICVYNIDEYAPNDINSVDCKAVLSYGISYRILPRP